MRKISILLTASLTAILITACGNTPAPAAPSAREGSDAIGQAASPTASAVTELFSTPTQSTTGYPGNTITVNSREQVSIVPDIAQIVYCVRTERKDAATCQQDNALATDQVIGLLKSLGVKEASIQTSDYYMHPFYNYSGNTAKIAGYEATTTLTVSDLPIEDLDEILARSVSGGINTIQSITYMASEYDEGYQQALTAAVNSAYIKAQVLASASGCKIGQVVNIQETSGYSQARYTDRALTNKQIMAVEEMSATADSAGEIMPGEITVEASILIEYQLISLAPSEAVQ